MLLKVAEADLSRKPAPSPSQSRRAPIAARRLIARRVRNTFPHCHAEFISSPLKHGGIAFRVVDDRGRCRSNIARVYGGKNVLTKSELLRLVKWAKGRSDFPHLPV
jgi:hypothetical protein